MTREPPDISYRLARAQIETLFTRIKKAKIDLIQVHNMGDVRTQLGILKELKQPDEGTRQRMVAFVDALPNA